jgi:hypothetical protein
MFLAERLGRGGARVSVLGSKIAQKILRRDDAEHGYRNTFDVNIPGAARDYSDLATTVSRTSYASLIGTEDANGTIS